MLRVAINGFGRIGRQVTRFLLLEKDVEIVAVNDLTDTKTLAHLFLYDSLYGRYPGVVSFDEKNVTIDSRAIPVYAEKEPQKLPWKSLSVDVVIESTGLFTKKEDAQKHIDAGARKVIISAPSSSDDIPTYIIGVNETEYKGESIVSNGSCTTNAIALLVKMLDECAGIENGFMTTMHSYTNDQRLLDLPHKDLRRARAAALSIIPTTTGAAKTVGKVLKHLNGKLDGVSYRVPTPIVSIVDLTAQVKKSVTKQELNAYGEQYKKKLPNIFDFTTEPLVSSDFKGNTNSVIMDSELTYANGTFVKISGWYDNEYGYSKRLAEIATIIGKK